MKTQELNWDAWQCLERKPLPLTICDQRLNVLYANQAFKEHFSPMPPVGSSLGAILDCPPSMDLIATALGNAVAEDNPQKASLEWRGRHWTISLSCHGAPTASGPIATIEWMDTTEYCQSLNSSLQRAVTAEAANIAKAECMAHLSHEIRTPLCVILGCSDLALEKGGDQNTMQRYAKVINSSGHHLLKVLNEFLDISKIEASCFEAEASTFSLVEWLSRTEDSLASLARKKGLAFTMPCAKGLPGSIVCDATRLTQILMNIGGNAIKFTPAGEVSIAVDTVATDAAGSLLLRFVVTDTGLGLNPEQQARLFRPFTQVHASPSASSGGSGLGLILSKRLAQAMGGDVLLVKSDIGQGSAFQITATIGVADENPFDA